MSGVLVSVLLPSRGRPVPLAEAVASLRDLADQPDRLEVLVAADDDDPPTVRAAEEIGATVLVSPRHGYAGLHLYVNALARRASGTWLALWNDDARMLTRGWDQRVAEAPVGVLWPREAAYPDCNTFPIVHRSIVDALGHVSLNPHYDSWLQEIADELGIHHRVDIEILHDRFDLTGGHDDETWRESRSGYRSAEFHSPEMVDARRRDIDLLKGAQLG